MTSNRQHGFIFNGLIGWVVSAFLLYLLWKIALLGFLGLIFGGISGGHNKLEVDPSAGGSVIGFFNGVLVPYKNAVSHRKKLQARFSDKTPSGKPLQYQLFYNDSYGLTLDLIETFDQRAALIKLDGRYDFLWGLVSGDQSGVNKASVDIPGATEVIDGVTRLLATNAGEYLRTLQRNNVIKTNVEHRKLIEQLTSKKSKQRLVLVAHSQGNLFALPAFAHAIKRSKNVTIVHAAPPLDTLKGEFTLSSRDVIINSLRPNHILPANVDPPPCGAECADVFGHGFAEVYFNQNTEAGQKTAASITKALE